MHSEPNNLWTELIGQEVVVDVNSPYVYLGRLDAERHGFLILEDADAHDLRDTATTRERYVMESRVHGIHVNRRRVSVNLSEVVAVSRLADVVVN